MFSKTRFFHFFEAQKEEFNNGKYLALVLGPFGQFSKHASDVNPDGSLSKYKSRIALADAANGASLSAGAVYSACADVATDRIVTQWALQHGAIQHTIDIGGAYYKGIVEPAENPDGTINEDSRVHFAKIPS